jgi:hypothetical protein
VHSTGELFDLRRDKVKVAIEGMYAAASSSSKQQEQASDSSAVITVA